MKFKNSLIIGGSSGIGLSLYQIIKNRENVIVWDKLKKNEDTYKIDVTIEKSIKQGLLLLRSKKFYLDNIFICHGIHQTKPLKRINYKEIKNIFENNFFSHYLIIKSLLKITNKNAKIFGISSIAACTPIPYSSTYSASKAALEAMYFSFKNEKEDICPIIIQPGNVNTGFNETGNLYKNYSSKDFEDYKKIIKKIHSKYGISPDYVAKKIFKVSQNKEPKFKYIIGKNAILANIAKRILGDEITLKLLKYYFKI